MQNTATGGDFNLMQWASDNKLTIGIGVVVVAIVAFCFYSYVTKTTPAPKSVSNADVTDAINNRPTVVLGPQNQTTKKPIHISLTKA